MSDLLLGGRYRLDEKLGRGGMATVWRGRDVHLDRAVALKVLDRERAVEPEALRRLHHEARTVARLDHPNIVGVHDFEVDGELAYLVMELVDGRDLADRLRAEGPLPMDRAVAIAEQVCDALAAAHVAGVVHRDIKPGNLIISRSGEVKVCDFGIAGLQDQGGRGGHTATGTVLGTSGFMAPEQATGGPVDARTDLYGLGCVLYAMLAGAPPFVASNPLAVLHQHLHEPPPPLGARRADLPPALDQLVTELLAKEPADRPANADLVHDRLTAIRNAAGRAVAGVRRGAAVPPAGAPGADGWRTEVLPGPAGAGTPRRGVSSLLREWWFAAAAGAVIVVTLVTVGVLTAALRNDGSANAPASALDPGGAAPRPGEAATADGPSPAATRAPSRPSQPAPTDWIGGVAAAIRQQVTARQLDPDAGADLLRRLADVAKEQQRGKHDKSVQKRADLGKRIARLRRDGKLTEAGYEALVAATGRAR